SWTARACCTPVSDSGTSASRRSRSSLGSLASRAARSARLPSLSPWRTRVRAARPRLGDAVCRDSWGWVTLRSCQEAGRCAFRDVGFQRRLPAVRRAGTSTRPSPGQGSFGLDLYKYTLQHGSVHAFDILGDPVRRRILELLADGEHSAGAVAEVVRAEFGISQPAVSQHLRVLREAGFAAVRAEGTRRIYAVRPEALHEV